MAVYYGDIRQPVHTENVTLMCHSTTQMFQFLIVKEIKADILMSEGDDK